MNVESANVEQLSRMCEDSIRQGTPLSEKATNEISARIDCIVSDISGDIDALKLSSGASTRLTPDFKAAIDGRLDSVHNLAQLFCKAAGKGEGAGAQHSVESLDEAMASIEAKISGLGRVVADAYRSVGPPSLDRSVSIGSTSPTTHAVGALATGTIGDTFDGTVPRSFTNRSFENVMGKPFNDEGSSLVERLVFDVLLAGEEGGPDLLSERLGLLELAAPSNQVLVLNEAKEMLAEIRTDAWALDFPEEDIAEMPEKAHQVDQALAAVNAKYGVQAGETWNPVGNKPLEHRLAEIESKGNETTWLGRVTSSKWVGGALLALGLSAAAHSLMPRPLPALSRAQEYRNRAVCKAEAADTTIFDVPKEAETRGFTSVDLCMNEETSWLCDRDWNMMRKDMPQVGKAAMDAYRADLQARGINVSERVVPASMLTPVQSEMRTGKVIGMGASTANPDINWSACDAPILAALDPHEPGAFKVIDGHHRWAACKLTGGDIRMQLIELDAGTVLADLESIPGVTKAVL